MPSVARGRPEPAPSAPARRARAPARSAGGAPRARARGRARRRAAGPGGARRRPSPAARGPGRGVPLAVLEVEVRDALLALGAALLTELVRLRGRATAGRATSAPAGCACVRKELAPLRQRTWCGEVAIERMVYAGAGCAVRAHHVPAGRAWGLLGAAPAAGLPEPDGGALAPAAPGRGRPAWPPRSPPPSPSSGPACPTPRPPASWRWRWAPSARLAPNTVRAYTRAAGRARQEQRPPRWPGGGA